MRRRPDTVLPIELSILNAGMERLGRGTPEFYGYLIAREIQDGEGARLLTAHGSLYRALNRMEKAGLLLSRWEDPQVAAQEDRPRRRFYRVTGAGETLLARAQELMQPSPASLNLQGAP